MKKIKSIVAFAAAVTTVILAGFTCYEKGEEMKEALHPKEK